MINLSNSKKYQFYGSNTFDSIMTNDAPDNGSFRARFVKTHVKSNINFTSHNFHNNIKILLYNNFTVIKRSTLGFT